MSKNNTPITNTSITSGSSGNKRQYPRTTKTAAQLELSAGTCLTTSMVDEFYKGMPYMLEHSKTGKYPVSDWLVKNGLMQCAGAVHITMVSLWNALEKLGGIRDSRINGSLIHSEEEYKDALSAVFNDLTVLFSFDDNIKMYPDYPIELLYSMRAWAVIDNTAVSGGIGKADYRLHQGAVSFVTFRNEMFREVVKRYNKIEMLPYEYFTTEKEVTKARRIIRRGQAQIDKVNTLIATLDKYINAVDNDEVKNYLRSAMDTEVKKRDKLEEQISAGNELYKRAQSDYTGIVNEYIRKKAARLDSTEHVDK